ncbi:MAG: hypothetical protein AB8H80_15125 [Planctomycetota bacterium]
MNTPLTLSLLCLLAAPAAAQQILQPVAVDTTMSGFPTSPKISMIDQSGLSASYVDGVTDFATFVDATSHANSNPASIVTVFVAGETITVDLGTSQTIDAIGLWGSQTFATTLTGWNLFADSDDNFGNGTTSSIGSFAGALRQGGDVFAFAPVTTRFVHIQVTANGGSNVVKIGEAAFRRAAPTDSSGRVLVQPTAVETSLVQLFPSFGVGNIINQSGFATPYVDGETDFASFVASTAYAFGIANALLANSNGQNQPNGVVEVGETITFDFGQARPVDGIAIWGTNTGGDALTGFALFTDNDDNFANGTDTPLGSFAASATLAGQAYGFQPVTTRFIHLVVTAHGGSSFLRLGEVAFGESPRIVNTIAHSGSFAGGIAYDAVSDEVIVVDDSDITITAYDRTTGVQTAQFPGPGVDNLIGVQVDITTGNLWVVGEDQVVRELDRTGAVLTSFSVDPTVDDASALAIDPVSDTLWISNDGNNTVTEFDKSGNPTGASFSPTGSTDGDGLAYDPTTRTFLLGEDNGNRILVVDRTGALLRTIDVGALGLSPEGLAVDTTTGIVFCGSGNISSDVVELAGILAAPPAGALTRYGTPCGARIAASDIVVDDGTTDSGTWIGYQAALPPGNAFLLVLGTARQSLPLAPILPSPCTAFALPDLSSVFGFTSASGRGGIRLALPSGFPGFTITAWGADIDLLNFGIPSSSAGLEIVIQ